MRGATTNLACGVLGVGEERTAGQCVDPVVVPEAVQQGLVHGGLEVGHVQGVVRLAVDTEILNLVEWNGLVLGRSLVRGLVTFGVCSEGAQVDFSRRYCPDRIHHNGDKRILEILV